MCSTPSRWVARPLMLFSQVNSITTFYLTFLVMAVGASLSGFMSIMTTIVQWFERRRATAMAYTQVGMSIGGILVPVLALSITTFGWRETAFASGVIVIDFGLISKFTTPAASVKV